MDIAAKLEQLLLEDNIFLVCEEASDLAGAFRLLHEDGAGADEVNDYIILSLALRTGYALTTYDRKLRARAVKRGIKAIP